MNYIRLMVGSLILLLSAILLPTYPVGALSPQAQSERRYTSLALDSSGTPHISFYDSTHGDLFYATKGHRGGWFVETVDSEGDVGSFNSIAVGADGTPHIVYVDLTNSQLKHAWKVGGVWLRENIPVPNGAGANIPGGKYPRIAIDSTGALQVSYKHPFGLSYTKNVGSIWTEETVQGPPPGQILVPNMGSQSDIAVDSSDNPHISYSGYDGLNVKYATKSGGNWAIQLVESVSRYFEGPSIAVDSLGRPYITYSYSYSSSLYNYTIRYAARPTAGPTRALWSIETVDSGWGTFSSIAVDAAGRSHISYWNGSLVYATRTGSNYTVSSWQKEIVDSGGSVGGYTSLKLDSNGLPRISYINYSNWDVKYAWNDGTVWRTEVVEHTFPASLPVPLTLATMILLSILPRLGRKMRAVSSR